MARALTKETILKNVNLVRSFKELYTNPLDETAERYSRLTEGLTENVRFFSSPGRAELIGNHTDHNHGFVIASSIDLDVACAVNKTDSDTVTVCSEGFEPFTVNVFDTPVDPSAFGTSRAILCGVLQGFKDRGYKVGGFVAHCHSTIFKGAGVSSSSAFELLLCEILDALYNGDKIDFATKAIISRFAENVYFGKPSGLMDQLTIARGGVSYMNFANEIPDSENAPWNFDDLSLVIINCGGDHCNLTDEYAAIRYEMNEVAGFFGKKVLAEVEEKDFFAALAELKSKYSGRAVLRSMHFFDENNRVKQAVQALNDNDKDRFLSLVTASGLSSYTLLQNCYPVGDTVQDVPFGLAICSHHPDTLAVRVHGGGFAGTILSVVETQKLDSYTNYMKKIFGNANVFGVKIRPYGAIEIK